jgi:uncharacterized membrane protein
MVLEIKTPHDTSWYAIQSQLPVFLSYFMSFVFIGIYWANHHHVVSVIPHVNASIIWANLNLLFWLSLIPFATGWMGENHFEKNTVILYSVLLMFCGAAFQILQLCIEKVTKNNSKLTEAFSQMKRKSFFSFVCYVLAIILSQINTLFSTALFLVVSIRWLIPDKNIEKAIRE